MIILNQQDTPLSKRFSAVSLLQLNKFIKIILIIFIVFVTFFDQFPKTIVEGSLAVINDNGGNSIINHSYNIYNIENPAEFLATPSIVNPSKINTKLVAITAYSSTPDQTDDTPFITASNTIVRDGIIAANFLPFGTKIRIPSLFGDKIFVVEDRMHHRYSDNHIDIWFPTRESALNFGIKYAEIEILP